MGVALAWGVMNKGEYIPVMVNPQRDCHLEKSSPDGRDDIDDWVKV